MDAFSVQMLNASSWIDWGFTHSASYVIARR